jgi:hypothetical protein
VLRQSRTKDSTRAFSCSRGLQSLLCPGLAHVRASGITAYAGNRLRA